MIYYTMGQSFSESASMKKGKKINAAVFPGPSNAMKSETGME